MKRGTKNPVRQWEITFPQVGSAATRETFHEAFPPSNYSICCRERHADGGEHLHMGIVFKKGISKANLLDWIVCKFPEHHKRIHISGIRVMRQWQDYCKKEDPEVFEQGSLEKKKKWSEDELMQDIQKEIMLSAMTRGEQKAYEFSRENDLRLRYIKHETEQQWLKDNGYLPQAT